MPFLQLGYVYCFLLKKYPKARPMVQGIAESPRLSPISNVPNMKNGRNISISTIKRASPMAALDFFAARIQQRMNAVKGIAAYTVMSVNPISSPLCILSPHMRNKRNSEIAALKHQKEVDLNSLLLTI